MLTVAIAGLGAIGLPVARALDAGLDGLSLVAVSARDAVRAERMLQGFRSPPAVVPVERLAQADIVVEAAPAALFDRIALPAIAAGRILVPASAGALLSRMHLLRQAQQTGARIMVPTGALLGLDAVRAAAEGPVESVTMVSRKPPAGLAGAPHLARLCLDLATISAPVRVFSGNALEAARGFPADMNVAAALALAGIGPVRTLVEIWADPTIDRTIHTVRLESAAAGIEMTITNVPSRENPRTGRIAALSLLACLRGLVSPLKVGS
jgi:aspartate dehydrogenase